MQPGAMGNRHSSNVSDDVKRQAECQTPIYEFVDLSGGGQLISLIKTATKDKDYTQVCSFVAVLLPYSYMYVPDRRASCFCIRRKF